MGKTDNYRIIFKKDRIDKFPIQFSMNFVFGFVVPKL